MHVEIAQRLDQAERRLAPDRRRTATRILSRYWLRGRRGHHRRTHDHDSPYIDRYRPREWAIILGIFFLSVADLVLTLLYLSEGGREANPLMEMALESGNGTFVVVKLVTTIIGLFVLLLHIRFRRVWPLLNTVLVLYVAVLLYHLALRFAWI